MTSNFYFGKNHLITKISSKEATETVYMLVFVKEKNIQKAAINLIFFKIVVE